MKLKDIKVGESVYSSNNSAWGLSPMIVKAVHHSDYIQCKHPIFGVGGFTAKELIPATDTRKSQLNEINVLQSQLNQLKNSLFVDNSQ